MVDLRSGLAGAPSAVLPNSLPPGVPPGVLPNNLLLASAVVADVLQGAGITTAELHGGFGVPRGVLDCPTPG